jgi:hypothetical protein
VSPVWIVSSVLAWIVIVLLVLTVRDLGRRINALQAVLGATPAVGLHDAVPGLDGPAVYVFHAPGCVGCEWIPDALAGEPALVGVAGDEALALPAAIRPDRVPALVGIAEDGTVAALGTPRSLADLREALAAAEGALPDGQVETDWGVSAPFWPKNDHAATSPPTASSGSSGRA